MGSVDQQKHEGAQHPPEAQAEFDEVFEHYLEIDLLLATSFETAFFDCLRQTIAAPTRFSFRLPPARRVNLTPCFGACYIAYMVWRGLPVILAIAHGKRRPYHWRKRIREARRMF